MSGISAQVNANIISPAKQYNDTHKYVSFDVDVDSAPNVLGDYTRNEIGLISPVAGKPPVDMVLFDHNLYDIATAQLTVETFYAQQLQRQYQYFQANRLKYKSVPGLGFRLYVTPMGDTRWECNYFAQQLKLGFTPTIVGNSDNFSSLATALNNYNLENLTNQAYVEWFGYFYPPATGQYQFVLGNTPAAFMWVGDVALVNYRTDNSIRGNNALDSFMMVKGTYYPVRIQYGSGASPKSPNAFAINITYNGAPMADGGNGQGLFYALAENTSRSAPYEPIQMQYALTQINQAAVDAGMYNLYISNFNIMNNYTNNQKVRGAKSNDSLVMGSVILLSCPQAGDATLSIQTTGEIVLKNASSQAVLKSLGPNVVTPQTYLELRGSNLYVMNPPVTTPVWDLASDTAFAGTSTSLQQYYSGAVVNDTWLNRYKTAYDNGITGSRLNFRETLDTHGGLYSSDGKSALYIQGNQLIYLTPMSMDLGAQGKYTTKSSPPNSFYLLSANGDLKMGTTMLMDASAKTLQYVPMGGNLLQYTNEFVAYTGPNSFPPNLTTVSNNPRKYTQYDSMEHPECEQTCIGVANCSHYYSYKTTDNVAHCIVNTNNDAPMYLPKNPTMSIQTAQSQGAQGTPTNPTLYKRKKVINSSCKINVYDVKHETVATEDAYYGYDAYSVNYQPYNPTPDKEGPCGVPHIAESINMFNYGSIHAPTTKATPTPTPTATPKEPFVSGYNPTPCQDLNGPKCLQEIQTNIGAVNAAFSQQQADNVEINRKYNELNDLIYNKFVPKYNKINGNPKYDAIDPDGKLANDPNSRRSLLNGMIEDTKDTMLQQNTYYILSNICAAFLLVAFFALVPE
jgi:hypothetical protein